MSTHINAYYGDVEEKQLALDKAKADLEASKEALKNHPDYEEPKKESNKAKVEEPKEESKDSKVKVKKK